MPTIWKVHWRDGPPDRLKSVREVDALLDVLQAKGERLLATIIGNPSAGTLGIGFDGDRAVLTHTPVSGDPPYSTSLGDLAAEGVTALFLQGRHHTEFDNRHFIPVTLAREAVRRFCADALLSDAVVWEEV